MIDYVSGLRNRLIEAVDRSSLRRRPDTERINAWLVDVHRRRWQETY